MGPDDGITGPETAALARTFVLIGVGMREPLLSIASGS
jgi:hypothetical protein